jgi:hypothetical protein
VCVHAIPPGSTCVCVRAGVASTWHTYTYAEDVVAAPYGIRMRE